MAIYHASTKTVSRSTGRSSVAAAAYRAGCELVDERTGLVHDYTRKGGIVSTEIVLPDGGSAERNALWNAAESAENRKDARTAREWVIALPDELNASQRAELAREFGAALAERYGVAVDIAIHQPDREGDNRNHHAHLLTTTRQVSRAPSGPIVLSNKADIELSDKDRRARGLGSAAEEVSAIRQLWEQTANRALEQAGHAERIDARSLKAQGIDREATQHLGAAANDMERRGVQTDRGDGNRLVRSHNIERAALAAEIINLQAERERREIERENRAQWEARREGERREAEKREAERREAELRAQYAQIKAERDRIERMSAAELRAEIEKIRPLDLEQQVLRDPAVVAANNRVVDLQEKLAENENAELQVKNDIDEWRKNHRIIYELHYNGFKKSSYLDERTDAHYAVLEEMDETKKQIEPAKEQLTKTLKDARQRLMPDWLSASDKVAALQAKLPEKVERERQETELKLREIKKLAIERGKGKLNTGIGRVGGVGGGKKRGR